MKVLLDTRTLPWWYTHDPRCNDAARDAILTAGAAESVVSPSEIEFERGLERIDIDT